MDFLNNINIDCIIICNNYNKNKILRNINKSNKLFNIKFLSLNELYNSFYFNYDEKTIVELINKYNLKYEIAKSYLDNMKYLDDIIYSSKKTNDLLLMKKYLSDNSLLIKDEFFLDYIKNKKIIFYGFDDIDKFMNKTIQKLKVYSDIEIINKQERKTHKNVIEFDHIEEEVEYVANKICELLEKGISVNKIKLTNIDEEYTYTLKRIFKMYNLPIKLNNNFLYSTIAGKYFLDNYDSNLSDVIQKMENKFDIRIVNSIIKVINKYSFIQDKTSVKELIIYDLKNTKVDNGEYKNNIEIINYNDIIDDDEYVFMLNFNNGSIPKVIKDEFLFNDDELKELGLNTSVELTLMEKASCIKSINTIKNLVITYKLESYNNNYLPSNLIKEMGMKTLNGECNYKYSSVANRIRLCKYLDRYYKYNITNKDLPLLYSNYDIPYKKYNNQFNGLNKLLLNEFVNNKIILSYSSMQMYNECAFKYYVNHILKIDPFEDNIQAFIGSLFHHILEIGINKEINVVDEINKYISIRNISNKEMFYINKLTKDIEFVLNKIKSDLKYTKLTNIETENKFQVIKKRNINFGFVGFIDKKMSFEENGKNYIALIDYKTYDADIKMDLIDYGLNIQLPIYLYLVKNKYKNVNFAGFYVQNILSSENKYDLEQKINDQKANDMKLKGFSNSDENILKLFDSSYADSRIIKGMKIKNDGNFYSSANILSNDEMNDLIVKIDCLIDECISNIENAKFDINPKSYNNNNLGCKYCKYRDLCYMKPKDINYIEVKVSDYNAELD